MGKKFNKEYISRIDRTINEVLNDHEKYDDWTQISLSVQQAVQAAANIWGLSDDEAKHKMAGFLHELCLMELHNLQNFDIQFSNKNP